MDCRAAEAAVARGIHRSQGASQSRVTQPNTMKKGRQP